MIVCHGLPVSPEYFTLVTITTAMNNSDHYGHQNYDQSEIFW